MSEISKEALAAACAEKVKQLEFSVKQSAFDSVRRELETELAIARVALLALRERAEPVRQLENLEHFIAFWRKVQSGAMSPSKNEINYTVWFLEGLADIAAPPAPVVHAETFDEWSRRCEIQLTLCRPEFREVAEITWNACCAAMLAAPGKQPLSVDVLAGALRNAPLAPSDNQCRKRASAVPGGWKLVPEELTIEMREAFNAANEEAESGDYDVWSPDHQWKAMLAAAPGKEG